MLRAFLISSQFIAMIIFDKCADAPSPEVFWNVPHTSLHIDDLLALCKEILTCKGLSVYIGQYSVFFLLKNRKKISLPSLCSVGTISSGFLTSGAQCQSSYNGQQTGEDRYLTFAVKWGGQSHAQHISCKTLVVADFLETDLSWCKHVKWKSGTSKTYAENSSRNGPALKSACTSISRYFDSIRSLVPGLPTWRPNAVTRTTSWSSGSYKTPRCIMWNSRSFVSHTANYLRLLQLRCNSVPKCRSSTHCSPFKRSITGQIRCGQ